MRPTRPLAALALLAASGLLLTACSGQKNGSDGFTPLVTAPSSSSSTTTSGSTSGSTSSTGSSSSTSGTSTSGTSSSGTTAVAYTQDIKPSCTRCHSNFGTYSGLMTVVTPGSASSKLVTKTQSSGSMYGYLPADRATNSALIKTWVLNGAPQNR
jgi:hypothetical protein